MKLMEECITYIKAHPEEKVYTNSDSLTSYIKSVLRDTHIETLKTMPEHTYPNVFCVTDKMEEFKREEKYIVFKIDDIKKYLDSDLRRWLVIISETIREGRALDNKSNNHYVVVNEDEPYAEKVWNLIKNNKMDKSQLETILANNPDLEISNISSLNTKNTPRKASKVNESIISPVKTIKASDINSVKSTVIIIDYPGSYITSNHYLGRMKSGNVYVKKDAQAWADKLTMLLIQNGVKYLREPIKVKIEGIFRNFRETPDIHNFKLLYDTIQRYTGFNDKYFKTETEIPIINKTDKPHLKITISEV
jgi:hypothetical protein